MNGYRRRIFHEMKYMLASFGPLNIGLDVASGEGW
jgi:hypothetical protein